MILSSHTSRPAPGPTQLPVLCGLKRPVHGANSYLHTLHFLYRVLWYTCVIWHNKMRNIYTNLIIVSSTGLEHPSVHPQGDSYKQFYGISIMHPYNHILPSTRLVIRKHKRDTVKLFDYVFLRMNTWIFETCRRTYCMFCNILVF